MQSTTYQGRTASSLDPIVSGISQAHQCTSNEIKKVPLDSTQITNQIHALKKRKEYWQNNPTNTNGFNQRGKQETIRADRRQIKSLVRKILQSNGMRSLVEGQSSKFKRVTDWVRGNVWKRHLGDFKAGEENLMAQELIHFSLPNDSEYQRCKQEVKGVQGVQGVLRLPKTEKVYGLGKMENADPRAPVKREFKPSEFETHISNLVSILSLYLRDYQNKKELRNQREQYQKDKRETREDREKTNGRLQGLEEQVKRLEEQKSGVKGVIAELRKSEKCVQDYEMKRGESRWNGGMVEEREKEQVKGERGIGLGLAQRKLEQKQRKAQIERDELIEKQLRQEKQMIARRNRCQSARHEPPPPPPSQFIPNPSPILTRREQNKPPSPQHRNSVDAKNNLPLNSKRVFNKYQYVKKECRNTNRAHLIREDKENCLLF